MEWGRGKIGRLREGRKTGGVVEGGKGYKRHATGVVDSQREDTLKRKNPGGRVTGAAHDRPSRPLWPGVKNGVKKYPNFILSHSQGCMFL